MLIEKGFAVVFKFDGERQQKKYTIRKTKIKIDSNNYYSKGTEATSLLDGLDYFENSLNIALTKNDKKVAKKFEELCKYISEMHGENIIFILNFQNNNVTKIIAIKGNKTILRDAINDMSLLYNGYIEKKLLA